MIADWLSPRLRRPPGEGRWVVVDVETSGLNPLEDRLIAVGALAVRDGAIDFADSFEVVLRQDIPSSRANVEVHRIGHAEQLAGAEPAAALRAFLEFVGDDPLVAYHARFDAVVLRRAIRARLGRVFAPRWLDVADVAPHAWPGRGGPALDDWLAEFGVPMSHRHRAIADCLGTAQVFLAVLAAAPRLGARSARALLALSEGDRWLR